jgi:hypothetical protein
LADNAFENRDVFGFRVTVKEVAGFSFGHSVNIVKIREVFTDDPVDEQSFQKKLFNAQTVLQRLKTQFQLSP